MRSVTTLLLLLMTFTSLSCAYRDPKFGDERKGECGEVPIGVNLDKGELDLAGAKLGDFSMAKLEIKFTPEFQKIISEADTNALVQDYIGCKAIARAGVHGDSEMVGYFMRLTQFLSTRPTGEQQTQWRQANPIPKQKDNPASPSPSVSQHSDSANSPNVVGDRNVVIINPRNELPGRESADQDDRMVYVECDHRPVPRTIPADDNLKGVIFFQRSPLLGEVRSPVFQPVGIPGDPNRWADRSGFGYVCQVINTGKIAVYHMLINFQLRFRKVIKQGPGSFSIGETTFSDDSWTGKIERLDVGPSSRFVFYMKNGTQDFLHVYMPNFVELRHFPEANQRKVRLTRQNDEPVHINPWIWPPKDAF